MRRKSAAVGASYLTGLLFASFFLYNEIFVISVIITLAVGCAVSVLFIKRYDIAAVLIFAALGITLFTAVSARLDNAADSLCKEKSVITAVITDKRTLGNDTALFTLSKDVGGTNVGMLFYSSDISAEKGDTLCFEGSAQRLYNTAYFSTADIYRSKRIVLSVTADSEITVKKGGFDILSPLYKLRERVAAKTDIYYADDGGALMKGIFLGDKSSLPDTLYNDITASGAAHMTAVSGMHLTLVVTVLLSVLSALGLSKAPKTRFAVTVLLTIAFMAFFGFTSSVLRSGIMIIIANTGTLFFRKSDPVTSVGLAVLLITIVNPLACLDAGLILSAVTTIGAGAIAPAVSEKLCKRLSFMNRKLSDILCVAVCAVLAGLIPSCFYFGMFSLTGAIVSIAALPFFTVCLVAMLIFTLTGATAIIAADIAHFCAEIMCRIFSFFASLPYSHFVCDKTVCLAVLLICAGIAAAVIIIKGKKYTSVVVCVSLVCFTAVNIASAVIPDDSVKILLHSDGENGCAVIISDDISAAVIAGNDKDELSAALNTLRLYNKYDPKLILLCSTMQNEDMTDTASAAHGFAENVRLCDEEYSLMAERLSIFCKDNKITLTVGLVTVNISDISEIRSDCVNIAWGYDKDITTKAPCLFFDKKQRSENGIPFYFTKIELKITYNGIVMKSEY